MKCKQLLLVHAFAMLLNPLVAVSADVPEQKQNPGVVWSMARNGQVLPALVMAENLLAAGRMPAGSLAQLMTVMSDGNGVERMLWRDSEPESIADEAADVFLEPAIESILELAAKRRVVILNESHVDQRHRAFAMQLALRLREIGFTHIGAETFFESISDSMKDGAPDKESGIYTIDPVFADFVRQAHKAGYQLFAYEQTSEQVKAAEGAGSDARKAREEAQARNILQVLRKNPRARLFIYVGGSHLLEKNDESGKAWMAKLLKQASDIDPLTIDQIFGTPHLSKAREGSLYKQVEHKLSSFPAVASDRDGRLLARNGTDVTVFHPADTVPTPRPNWLFMCGYRAPYDVPLERRNARRLVRAFLINEPAGSIPVDQVLLERNSAVASLMLPPGRYRIESQSENGDSMVLSALFDTSLANTSWYLRSYQSAASCTHG